jgi:hypothetical protein
MDNESVFDAETGFQEQGSAGGHNPEGQSCRNKVSHRNPYITVRH